MRRPSIRAIGEALGYWQIGDADSLHKYYADDVVVVSGAWEPPVIGWDNFLKAYQAQRAQVSGERMDRSNTLIKVNGNSAWATYQFVYAAQIGGQSGSIPRAHYPFPGEAGGPMGDCAEPLLDRGLHASRARHPDGFGPARQALEALEALVNPDPRAGQQERSGQDSESDNRPGQT